MWRLKSRDRCSCLDSLNNSTLRGIFLFLSDPSWLPPHIGVSWWCPLYAAVSWSAAGPVQHRPPHRRRRRRHGVVRTRATRIGKRRSSRPSSRRFWGCLDWKRDRDRRGNWEYLNIWWTYTGHIQRLKMESICSSTSNTYLRVQLIPSGVIIIKVSIHQHSNCTLFGKVVEEPRPFGRC